ncbi:hypothetical protein DY120_07405 [Apilactobacillus micheneri]|uniref:Uncharacterized protein n=1 Tax=Apilactobacillus micheneri TaxID=1899430 RepID=A0ABY2YVL6_9LACO|nr:hypothetical protein [Apilactobacillus micheneri]TPR23124.1 hypothetical protein DY114_07390 [Apilactobacillus micheneri]TPR24442.1 hypothetical protein DY111_07405 [Apilactobacillus micheneri]TPR29389.1 hypothetical protein DY120_07405 [Apilactobacillus micheneri]TPR34596.1 hypothetical protein DY027_07395 [Apilactobacillus micheneri]
MSVQKGHISNAKSAYVADGNGGLISLGNKNDIKDLSSKIPVYDGSDRIVDRSSEYNGFSLNFYALNLNSKLYIIINFSSYDNNQLFQFDISSLTSKDLNFRDYNGNSLFNQYHLNNLKNVGSNLIATLNKSDINGNNPTIELNYNDESIEHNLFTAIIEFD